MEFCEESGDTCGESAGDTHDCAKIILGSDHSGKPPNRDDAVIIPRCVIVQ